MPVFYLQFYVDVCLGHHITSLTISLAGDDVYNASRPLDADDVDNWQVKGWEVGYNTENSTTATGRMTFPMPTAYAMQERKNSAWRRRIHL